MNIARMFRSLPRAAEQAFALLSEPGFLKAAMTWPVFSVTSFLMLSRLSKLGVRPRTVIDIGANVGQFAVAAAMRFPEAVVHCYEPLPECFDALKNTAAKFLSLQPHQLALGESVGDLRFNVNSYTLSSSALPLADAHKAAFPFAREVRTITVPSSTLDSIYADGALTTPILLKLDVQGYEVNVLRGGKVFLQRVDYIVTELSFEPLYVGEMPLLDTLAFLDGLGFDFMQPLSFLDDPRHCKYLQMDGLFRRRIEAVSELKV
jgi:FkbM family methyltransferase